MKFKRAIALIMIFAVVFSLSACGSEKERAIRKTLVIAIQDEIEGTDIRADRLGQRGSPVALQPARNVQATI